MSVLSCVRIVYSTASMFCSTCIPQLFPPISCFEIRMQYDTAMHSGWTGKVFNLGRFVSLMPVNLIHQYFGHQIVGPITIQTVHHHYMALAQHQQSVVTVVLKRYKTDIVVTAWIWEEEASFFLCSRERGPYKNVNRGVPRTSSKCTIS